MRELIEKLKQYPPDMEVLARDEGGSMGGEINLRHPWRRPEILLIESE